MCTELQTLHVKEHVDPDHLPHQRLRSRVGDELHHQEIERLWLLSANEPTPNCCNPKEQVRPGKEALQ